MDAREGYLRIRGLWMGGDDEERLQALDELFRDPTIPFPVADHEGE
jgi:hypothetical protein